MTNCFKNKKGLETGLAGRRIESTSGGERIGFSREGRESRENCLQLTVGVRERKQHEAKQYLTVLTNNTILNNGSGWRQYTMGIDDPCLEYVLLFADAPFNSANLVVLQDSGGPEGGDLVPEVSRPGMQDLQIFE